MNELFTIGDFCFRFHCDDRIGLPENFLKFRGGTQSAYTYVLEPAEDFPKPEGKIVAQRDDLLVTRNGQLECRWIGVRGNPRPYAYYEETDEHSARILVRLQSYDGFVCDPAFISLLALERRLAKLDGMILHCAYVEYQGEAILFSAPSETGKTTQANLWEKYRGARTVNGDRGLLQIVDGRWTVRGWPVCGSSEICHNEDMPVRAIVMLSQAPEDTAEPMHPAKAFSQIYSQITINRWNREANLRVMELLEDLISSVPVYHLACTMNETAVQVLEQAIL